MRKRKDGYRRRRKAAKGRKVEETKTEQKRNKKCSIAINRCMGKGKKIRIKKQASKIYKKKSLVEAGVLKTCCFLKLSISYVIPFVFHFYSIFYRVVAGHFHTILYMTEAGSRAEPLQRRCVLSQAPNEKGQGSSQPQLYLRISACAYISPHSPHCMKRCTARRRFVWIDSSVFEGGRAGKGSMETFEGCLLPCKSTATGMKSQKIRTERRLFVMRGIQPCTATVAPSRPVARRLSFQKHASVHECASARVQVFLGLWMCFSWYTLQSFFSWLRFLCKCILTFLHTQPVKKRVGTTPNALQSGGPGPAFAGSNAPPNQARDYVL